MANDDSPAGFLSRWSRRKADVREGRPLDEPKPAPSIVNAEIRNPQALTPSAATATAVPSATRTDNPEASSAASAEHKDAQAAILPPTLADVQQLTPDSDYSDFMAHGVAPDVKNAAMKKLFTDPHFNVMDRLDIYIDDYSQPDPLPLAMLRQMTSAKTLNLFNDEDEASSQTPMSDMPAAEEVKVVAQSVPAENNSNTEPSTHDHADLRLQPDPTSRPEGAEPEPV